MPPSPGHRGVPGTAPTGGPTSPGPPEQGEPPFLPAPTLPKGGGAIRGIGEKVSVNPAKGTCSLQVPMATSPARSAPELALSYDSGAGSSSLGLGWRDTVPRISRKTDKGLPTYTDADTFLLSGAEDLVPSLVEPSGPSDGGEDASDASWGADAYDETIDGALHRVERFRPRTEGAFTRIERCRNVHSGEFFWRSVSRDNVLSVYGRTAEARIADPGVPDRVFEWLLEETRDDRGNVVAYTYKAEDDAGVDPGAVWEGNRLDGSAPTTNRYLKQIRYGNVTPGSGAGGWHFAVVFDYGDHDPGLPTPDADRPWPVRPDPFSTYRAGFEVRTWRLCRRVLMFHDFPVEELGPGPLPRLVRSTDLTHDLDPAGARLVAVAQTGYLWDEATASYQADSLPPLELEYTRAAVDDQVRTVDPDSLDNLPAGVDGSVYLFTDLDGEGLPGALTQQGGAWYYKRNLGGGRFGAQERLPTQPSIGGDGGSIQLVDLAGAGRRALVRHGPVLHGYQEREPDGGWATFAAFPSVPTVDWSDPALLQADLDGDGLTDLLLTEGETFRWHRSLGREGYAPEQRVVQPADEQRGPVLLRSDPTCAVLLADMSGDGLADLVRVRNGEVCYWPCLGHGRFGAQVTMGASPVFDHPDQFDASRLRLADVDGSGTTDLVYLGRGEVRYWPNQSGNGFGEAQAVAAFPDVDQLDTVDVVDLLGTGTSCLVWSSPSPRDSGRQLRYVDLCRGVDTWLPADDPGLAGHKPDLLRAVRNGLGGETRLAYAPSTRFFLADRTAGTPWATRLPFPVHVVERQETYDHVARTRLVTTYRYRHGYYDGAEREFRGFGLVEQTDAETFPGSRGAGLFAEPEATELHRPPVRTRTWFHTGAFLDEHVVAAQFASEYWDGDAGALPLEDSELPSGLSDREACEARRALAGQPLRTEVYADDGSAEAAHPYIVTEHRYRVVLLQPAQDGRSAVLLSHPLETVTAHYEREPADPRVGHELTLEVDRYGNVLQAAAIGYPRRAPDPAVPEQGRTSAVWTVNRVTNVDAPGQPYRLGVPVETRAYEVTALPPAPAGGPPGAPDRYPHTDLAAALTEITARVAAGESGWEVPYETPEDPSSPHPQRRLVEHARTRYWNDTQTAPLPLGEAGARALVHQTYKIAFTPGLLTGVYGDRVDATLLADEGRYLQWDGVWWIPSGVRHYDPAAFFLPVRLVDPFGNESSVEYDDHGLLVVAAQASQVAPLDVLVTRTAHDYRLLAVREVTDPNGNRSRVAFDTLGRVVASWVTGKGGAGPDPGPDAIEGDPPELPGAVFTYGAWSWRDGHGPVWAHVETRERHGDPGSPWQRSRAWTDGSGRIAMTKTQAEPGLAWALDEDGQPVVVDTTPEGKVRWVGTGRTVFDNKGQPVKQYEPYFSVALDYEDEAALVEQGVTPILHYDPLGRLVRTENPDGTESRVVFDPWRQETWDRNDAVLASRWYADRGSPDPAAEPEPADPERRAAWLAARHAGTPAVTHLDALGRAVLAVADGGPLGTFATRTELDVEGNTRSVTDAQGVVVLRQDNDLAGRVLHTDSPDAGERWTLPDVAGAPIRSWDSRGHTFRHTHDPLRRPVGLWIVPPPSDNGGNGNGGSDAGGQSELLVELTFYGEAHPEAAERNLRGRPYLSFDSAGLTVAERHDFKGNLLVGRRQLAVTYQTTPDWSSLAGLPVTDVAAAAATLLDAEQFASSTEYDALNRPVTQTLPDATVLTPGYNEAGLLDAVSARLQGGPDETPFVTDLDYDAKGQRELIAYGNGVRTLYEYDRFTYRLARLLTLRGPEGNQERLQDLRYSYDPVGNVVEIRDDALQTVFFAGQEVKPSARYAYDALDRLDSATGREHVSLGPQPDHQEPGPSPLPHPNDTQALRRYTQTYVYDGVGNILAMVHAAGPTGSWTREYEYATDSNRLLSHGRPSPQPPVTFSYDAHGNMTSLPHLAGMTWDHADRLHAVDLGGGGTAFYTYDSGGRRVRKVIERQGGLVEERIYLGGHEVHRRRLNSTLTFERQTVHVMDDTRRVALVETLTVEDGTPVASPSPRIRYQLANHLGSCALELDQSAAVISYEEYHPYGTTSLWLTASGSEVNTRRYRYTGKEKDEETNLYYHGARYYAPWLARWTTPDPAGLVDGPNPYPYVKDNPVRSTDPTGMQECRTEDYPAPSPAELEANYSEPGLHAMASLASEETQSVQPASSVPGPPSKPTPARIRTPDPSTYVPAVGDPEFRPELGDILRPLTVNDEGGTTTNYALNWTLGLGYNLEVAIVNTVGRLAHLPTAIMDELEVSKINQAGLNFTSMMLGPAEVEAISAGLGEAVSATPELTQGLRTLIADERGALNLGAFSQGKGAPLSTHNVEATNIQLESLAAAADDAILWVAGDEALTSAHLGAMTQGPTVFNAGPLEVAQGVVGYRNALQTVPVQGGQPLLLSPHWPIHHFNYPRSTYPTQVMNAENLFLTGGRSTHQAIHGAFGGTQRMDWKGIQGAEKSIRDMFLFWINSPK